MKGSRKVGRTAGRKAGSAGAGGVRKPDAIVAAKAARTVDEIVQAWNAVRDNGQTAFLTLCERVYRDIFDRDAAAMLGSRRTTNPKYADLLSRAGHDLGVTRADVFDLVRFAGWDRTVGGNFWKHLKPEQKKALLPLGEHKAMLEGAQHAVEFDLNPKQIGAWVHERRRKAGGKPRRRRFTAKTVETLCATINDLFGDPAALEKLDEIADALEPAARARLARSMAEAARRLLEAAARVARE